MTISNSYPEIAKWAAEISESTYNVTYNALLNLAKTGSCSLNPPIMGALVTLGYFDKKYTAVKLLEILEAIA